MTATVGVETTTREEAVAALQAWWMLAQTARDDLQNQIDAVATANVNTQNDVDANEAAVQPAIDAAVAAGDRPTATPTPRSPTWSTALMRSRHAQGDRRCPGPGRFRCHRCPDRIDHHRIHRPRCC